MSYIPKAPDTRTYAGGTVYALATRAVGAETTKSGPLYRVVAHFAYTPEGRTLADLLGTVRHETRVLRGVGADLFCT